MNRIALALSVSALFVLVGCGKKAEDYVQKEAQVYIESVRSSEPALANTIPKATVVGTSRHCLVYELILSNNRTLYFTETPAGSVSCGGITIK